MRAANFSEFRNGLKSYLDDVEENNETVIIKRSKGNGAVLISLDEYNSMQETMYLSASRKNANHLLKGIEEAKSGKRKEVSLEEFESVK